LELVDENGEKELTKLPSIGRCFLPESEKARRSEGERESK
jgi:hypothetical protein